MTINNIMKWLNKKNKLFKNVQINIINIWANNKAHDGVYILLGYGNVSNKNVKVNRLIIFNFEIQLRRETIFKKWEYLNRLKRGVVCI